jgi:type II secretory pathway pseudopilin PulG
MRTSTRKSGFTMTEVIFAVAISLMTVSLVMSLTTNMLEFAEEEQMQNEIEREMTLLLDYFKRDTKIASGVVLDYPAVSTSTAQALVFEIPEFDAEGIAVPGGYDYVAYEHFWESRDTRRTIYDDDQGLQVKDRRMIDAGECWFWAFANGVPLESIEDPSTIDTIQISAFRHDYAQDWTRYYWRSFVVASTLRNK